MKRLLSAVLFLVSAVACSADEGANPGVRCESDTDCSASQVCYRDFCIRGDRPIEVDVDASSSPISEVEAGPRDVADGEIARGSDAGEDSGSPADASAPMSSLDGAAAPVDPPMSGPTDPVDPPPTTPGEPPLDATAPVDPPPTPVVDAGSTPPVAVDAGNTNPAQLLVCLPSCSNNRNSACLFCLRSVLMQNPQVCVAAEQSRDETVGWLCDALCRTEDCGGRP